MAELLSPGVYINEIDASTIVPSVSNNVAFFAGSFTKGPIDQPYVVTTKTQLIEDFGAPTNENYNEWYQCYKFFDYANQLIVTRGFEDSDIVIRIDNPLQPKDFNASLFELSEDPFVGFETFGIASIEGDGSTITVETTVATGYEIGDSIDISDTIGYDATYTIASIVDETNLTITDATSAGTETVGSTQKAGSDLTLVTLRTLKKYDFTYSLGDWVNIADSATNAAVEEDMYIVSGISTIPAGDKARTTQVTVSYQGDATADIDTKIATQKVWSHSIRHLNGGTEAFVRGDYDSIDKYPTTAPASSEQNVDYIDASLSVLESPDVHSVRSAYYYSLVKNYSEWEYNSLKGGENPMYTFLQGDTASSRLKFFNKTATADKVEICVANPEDFIFNNGENYAIAFSETSNGVNITNTYLTSLFYYYPGDGEIAIAVKSGQEVETFVVSFDETALDGNGISAYIENVINQQSKFIYVLENKDINDVPASYMVCDRFGWDVDQTGKILVGTPDNDQTDTDPATWTYGQETYNLICQGGRNPQISIGSLKDAYNSVEDKELYEIDVVIGNEYTEDTGYDNQNPAIVLANARKDCVAYIGSLYEDVVNKTASSAVQGSIDYIVESDENKRAGSVKPLRTMFAAYFANYFRIFDNFNKKYRWINVAGDMAGIRCQVSTTRDPWWVSAGTTRGVIVNIDKMAFTPNQEQRDNMYKNGINPLVSFPAEGNLVWGNKTLHPVASSFDRINVRTLFNTLERSAAKAARSQVFEFNDAFTRNAMLSMFNPYLSSVKAGRGIVDFLVVCDETNNPPAVIQKNEMRVDIYIKPNYAAEMILLTFTNVGTRSFASVMGA